MQAACEQTEGAMAAIIGEERAKVAELCRDFDIEAANFNAPGQIIVSGEKLKVAAAVAGAKDREMKKVIPLKVAGAYHSRLMEPARAAFAGFLESVPFLAPRFTVFSNTTGQALSDPLAIKAALVKQVVSSVLWEECMKRGGGRGDGVLGTRARRSVGRSGAAHRKGVAGEEFFRVFRFHECLSRCLLPTPAISVLSPTSTTAKPRYRTDCSNTPTRSPCAR